MSLTQEAARSALATVQDPDLHKDLVTLNMARDIEVDEAGNVKFRLVLTTPACPLKSQIEDDCRKALSQAGANEVEIETTSEVRGFRGVPGKTPIEGVRNVFAVSSGKGGVGKTTVSVNLAISLAQQGARTGILDADITGPNIPLMMGVSDKPTTDESGKKLVPPVSEFGVKVMSMGLLLDPNEAVVWRGPMLHNAINQFLRDVDWGELDYLVVDLPPGTSDAQLTISQAVPLAGAVVVSTPQDVALMDSSKGLHMFERMQVPVLGVIENMSYFRAPDTGTVYDIFGSGGARKAAEANDIECLGQLPIQISLREGSDKGRPVTVSEPDSEAATLFRQIAQRTAAKLSIQAAQVQSVV